MDALRYAAGAAARSLSGKAGAVFAVPGADPAAAIAVGEGALLGAYSYDTYRSSADGRGPLGTITLATGAAPEALTDALDAVCVDRFWEAVGACPCALTGDVADTARLVEAVQTHPWADAAGSSDAENDRLGGLGGPNGDAVSADALFGATGDPAADMDHAVAVLRGVRERAAPLPLAQRRAVAERVALALANGL